MIMEGRSFLDSPLHDGYYTDAIGFREISKLDDAGQAFTMFLAIGGVGATFYGLLAVIPAHPRG